MTTTTYYNLNIVEGTDIVNPLTVDNPNYETIDETMHDNAVAGVTLATEIANATVHAITRENSECAVIRFIATSNWKAGDTVTVDGVPVTALLPSGETLPDGAYVINANVLCILTGTNLTVYAERKKVDNATDIAYNETNVAAAITEMNDNLDGIEGRLGYIRFLERKTATAGGTGYTLENALTFNRTILAIVSPKDSGNSMIAPTFMVLCTRQGTSFYYNVLGDSANLIQNIVLYNESGNVEFVFSTVAYWEITFYVVG